MAIVKKMKLAKAYNIFTSDSKMFLANIENGDLFEINDVVWEIVNMCTTSDSIDSLCDILFEKYKDDNVDYGKDKLKEYIFDMINSGFLEE